MTKPANKIIVLTGPESTGKSMLTKELAGTFHTTGFPEYAREYLCGKTGYTYEDVVYIARKQIEQYEKARGLPDSPVFLDTWLIITKVWFEWAFRRIPDWLEEAIASHPVDLFLLCKPDIPWEPDPLRENGGETREELYHIYKHELIKRNFCFAEVAGTGEKRLACACAAVREILNTGA